MMPVHQFPESDCKTSPLALLVQICSNIGAEKPSTKNSDKNGTTGGSNSNSSSNSSSDEIRVTKEKDVLSCSPANSVHSASSLTSSNRTSRNEEATGFSSSKRNTPSECRSSPLHGRSSVERRTTPGSVHSPDVHHRPKSSSGDKTPTSSTSTSATTSTSHESHPSATSSGASGSSSTSEPTYSSSSIGLDFSRDSSSLLKDGASSSSLAGLGSYKAGLNGLNPLALANCSGCSPVAGHIPLDAAATYPLAGALKGGYSFGSTLSPYMNYARMKSAAAGGAATFVPVCRDPYCTNCQLAAQLPYAQDRLAAHMSGLYSGGLPGYPVPGFASPASSAFASSVLPRPNVCSWMVGDNCCGKRFASSEELLQHLRTHTSMSGSSLPMYSTGVSLPSALAMEACGLYTTPSLTTPAGLRRTYPTSLSPVSSLSAAGRYHPYKPPGLSPLSSAPLPPLGHPGLSFYNPYSGVYGKG